MDMIPQNSSMMSWDLEMGLLQECDHKIDVGFSQKELELDEALFCQSTLHNLSDETARSGPLSTPSPTPIGKNVNVVHSRQLTQVHRLEDRQELLSLLKPLLNQEKADQVYENSDLNTLAGLRRSDVFPIEVEHSLSPSVPLGPPLDYLDDNDPTNERRFRGYQQDLWYKRFEELVAFKKIHGHCDVPYGYQENQPLAQWVKRQRYQLRLKNTGKKSSMTQERFDSLNELGFCWDYHEQLWEERLEELSKYIATHGHCEVQHTESRGLSMWVKRQRRHYHIFMSGKKTSNMTPRRIEKLRTVGFDFGRCPRP